MLGLGHKLGLGATGMMSAIQMLLSKLNARSTYFENRVASKNLIKDIENDGILDKATILLTPTAYSDARLHSVKTYTGTELVTNGDFANGLTGWTKGTAASTTMTLNSENQMVMTESGEPSTYLGAFTPIDLTEGNTYKFQYDVISTDNATKLRVGTANGVDHLSYNNILYTSTNPLVGTPPTTKIVYFVADATQASDNYLYIGGRDDVDSLVVDNISVIDVSSDFDFERDSSATRVDEDGLIQDMQSLVDPELVENGDFSELGSELVVNGTFDTNITGWTGSDAAAEIEWDNGKVKVTNGDGTAAGVVSSAISVENGKTYIFRFESEQGTSENQSTSFGFGTSTVNVNKFWLTGVTGFTTDGLHTHIYTADFTGTGYVVVKNATTVSGKYMLFDNVSVKQLDPNDYWTVGTGWSIEEGEANSDGTESVSYFRQNGIVNLTSTYKVQFTVSDSSSGTLNFLKGNASVAVNVTSNDTYTFYTTWDGSTGDIVFQSLNFVGSINNISVKEYAITPLDV